MSQDVFFVRNNYHHIFRNGFIAARGHNIQVIGSRGHIHFYPSSYSPAVISNVCTTLSLGCSNRNRTGYWRYEGNEFEKLILGGCSNEVNSDWFSIIHDKTFKAGGLPRKISGGATGVFSNCTFDGVDVSVGSAINCTFRNSPGGYARDTGGRWKNCIFEDSKLQRCESTNIYQNCTFRNASAIFSLKCKQTFDGCTFENVKFGHHAGKGIEGEIRTNCKMKGENALPVEWIK